MRKWPKTALHSTISRPLSTPQFWSTNWTEERRIGWLKVNNPRSPWLLWIWLVAVYLKLFHFNLEISEIKLTKIIQGESIMCMNLGFESGLPDFSRDDYRGREWVNSTRSVNKLDNKIDFRSIYRWFCTKNNVSSSFLFMSVNWFTYWSMVFRGLQFFYLPHSIFVYANFKW